MIRGSTLTAGAVLFIVLATANAGGYRFGVSDQAFYLPAVELTGTPELFPRDRAVLAPQMRLWVGDDLLAGLARLTDGDLPALFASLHVVTLLLLFAGAVALARSLGCDWWTIALFVLLLALRHRITKTGANTLEGYMHPRMLAFAIGVGALALIARGRLPGAAFAIAVAGLVHTTTAAWFGGVLFVATLVRHWSLPRAGAILALAAIAAGWAVWAGPLHSRLGIMDDAWLAVFADRDYLFPLDWPVTAWLANLGYAGVIIAVYRRRRALRVTTPGEPMLVAGLLALVAGFLLSVPLAEARVALVVQAQVNRVFWLLDLAAALYVAWWVMADPFWRPSARRRLAAVALVFALVAGRGVYILAVELDRRLWVVDLPDSGWTDTMRWLRGQPASWHVLADPAHASRFGSSVRVAAGRDTLLEIGKDPILALYDRTLAMRVAERSTALSAFDRMTTDDVRLLDERFTLDVFVATTATPFEFPVLYRNAEFTVYDLR